jgi:hypothetical protein
MIRSMLSSLFRKFLTSSPTPPAANEQVPAGDELTERFDGAVSEFRDGRIPEAVAECNAMLELDPDYWPAHSLLAVIELPGDNYSRIIERIHAHLSPRTYLEIGVAAGTTIRLAGPATRALGVDPEPIIEFELAPNIKIFAQASDDFFARNDVRAELGGLPIDLAFIDGMHNFEFALRDFMNVEALCARESTILIHDIYPLDVRTAARDRVTTFWSGDIWRLGLLLRKYRPDLVFHTIAASPTGLAIVRNLDPQSRYIRDHLDELVAEFLAVDFSALHGRKAERLALFPNDWARISAVLDAPVTTRA